ncbi:MAG: hypothetical protein ACHRXM_15820 [Isosphaerales bacterium]
MIISTTKCEQLGHPEFVLEADVSTVPDIYIRETVETVERMVADGSVFRPGETFQIGWMLTRVQEQGPTHLTLEEPDMRSLPIRWIPGVTHTLRQKMVQVFMLDSVSLRHEMQIPSIRQSLITCTRFAASDFFMTRSEGTNERDSGWFVGCLDEVHDHNDPGNLCCVSLYEAYLGQKGIQGFVTFPVGATVVVDRKNGVTILNQGEPLGIVRGSFLDTWLQRSADGSAKESYPE